MKQKTKNIGLAVLAIVVGFILFSVYAFGGGGVFGILAMIAVFIGVFYLVKAFTPDTKPDPNPLYRKPKKPQK